MTDFKPTLNRSDQSRPRIVCVVGPTSSGKTGLGIRLAKLFEGEIINADSRQVYKDIGIGTGKPPGTRGNFQGHRAFLYEGIPHYLMDFLDPTQSFTVVEWREKAIQAIKPILKRGHLPIVVGGTGLYVSALVDNFTFPQVPPNPSLRSAFETKPLRELVHLLLNLDPEAKQTVDLHNPRRVIRALEVSTFTGKPFTAQKITGQPLYDVLQIGLTWPREKLYQRIDAEIERMVERGWVEEIRAALKRGIPENAPALTSIGYREFIAYLKGHKTLEQAIHASKKAVHHYAKRQETWLRRDKRIHWVRSKEEGVECVRAWLRERSRLVHAQTNANERIVLHHGTGFPPPRE